MDKLTFHKQQGYIGLKIGAAGTPTTPASPAASPTDSIHIAPQPSVPISLKALKASPTPAKTTLALGTSALHGLALAVTPEFVTQPAVFVFTDPELEKQPLRTYRLTSSGAIKEVSFDALEAESSAAPAPRPFHPVTADDLDAELNHAIAERRSGLKQIATSPSNTRVVPKDATLHPTAFYMSYDSSDSVSKPFIRQMADIGRLEGFRVVARVPEADDAANLTRHLTPQEKENLTVIAIPGKGDVWSEDNGERTLNGGVSFPAFVGDGDLVNDSILRARVHRLYPGSHLTKSLTGDNLQTHVTQNFPRADFDVQGAVDDRSNQESMAAMGLAGNSEIRENLSYIEGGNVLPGTLPNGEGYAVIGRDSVAVTQAVLERDTHHTVKDATVRQAIAKDLGIQPENVFPVEQPGTFHIDMSMALLGPGQVLLNDSRQACAMQEKWLREDAEARKPHPPPEGASSVRNWIYQLRSRWWNYRHHGDALEGKIEALRGVAENRAYYEDRAEADLKAAGLQVYRVAGTFVDPDKPNSDIANFLNIRQGTNASGEKFVICLGGMPRAEGYIAQKFMHDIPAGVSRIYFLDRSLTQSTLDLSGGIKCRTKGEGWVDEASSAKV